MSGKAKVEINDEELRDMLKHIQEDLEKKTDKKVSLSALASKAINKYHRDYVQN